MSMFYRLEQVVNSRQSWVIKLVPSGMKHLETDRRKRENLGVGFSKRGVQQSGVQEIKSNVLMSGYEG